MNRAADPLLGCGFDDGKARQAAATPNCPPPGSRGRADSGENCGLKCDPGNKKGGRKAAAIGKNPHFYTESTITNEI